VYLRTYLLGVAFMSVKNPGDSMSTGIEVTGKGGIKVMTVNNVRGEFRQCLVCLHPETGEIEYLPGTCTISRLDLVPSNLDPGYPFSWWKLAFSIPAQ
jgi:hypothetical protein